MIDDAILAQAAALLARCRAAGVKVATAESLTGGLIAATLTAHGGSSAVLERGFVTYGNAAKHEMLGVPMALIATHGAVSEAVARAMAEGAIASSDADLTVAVTGIAGPGGAVPGKPVGTVWLAVARRGGPTQAELLQLAGDRGQVRERTVEVALDRLLAAARSA